MAAISVIMPCYNQGYQLKRILKAYDCQTTTEGFELIAVDDASPDETFQVLNSYHPLNYQLKIFRQDKNRGPAAARNLAILEAKSPLVVFVGDDIMPGKNFIQDHLDAHRKHSEPETAILGRVTWPDDMPVNTLMRHIDGVGAEQFSYYYLKDGEFYDFRHFYTANISAKRELLSQVSYWFDTDFPFAAFEDAEFSFRLSQKGMKILYRDAAIGSHYHYHNIWTFSERQYRAGLMAVLLTRKHPAVGQLILGKNWPARLWMYALIGLTQNNASEKISAYEETLLHLLSKYEWSESPLLDGLYIRTLNYFFQKGVVAKHFEKSVFHRSALNYYTKHTLTSIIYWYANECRKTGLPFPEASTFSHKLN